MKIVIIGAGAVGKVIANIVKENRKNSVSMWDVVPGKVKKQRPLKEIVPTADVVFLCLPLFALREAVASIRPHLRQRTIIVSFSKSIEENTNLTIDMLLTKILPWRQPFCLLFGPMLAAELSSQGCGHAVAASTSRSALPRIVSLFSGTQLRAVKSYDVRGVALCGALKNIFAIGIGIASALGVGDNFRGAYFAIAADEMRRAVKMLGGRPETADGYAGLADMVATGLSVNSRNRQVGCAIGTRSNCRGSEGSRAAFSVATLLGKKLHTLPLLHTITRVLESAAEPEEVVAVVCSY